jgi:hypothetical protein
LLFSGLCRSIAKADAFSISYLRSTFTPLLASLLYAHPSTFAMILDPSTALAVVSLVYDVSKDLYTFYQSWQHGDDDIRDLRVQLLLLQGVSQSVHKTLERERIIEQQAHGDLKLAIESCEKAVKELAEYMDKFLKVEQGGSGMRGSGTGSGTRGQSTSSQGARFKKLKGHLQVIGRRTQYALHKDTIKVKTIILQSHYAEQIADCQTVSHRRICDFNPERNLSSSMCLYCTVTGHILRSKTGVPSQFI